MSKSVNLILAVSLASAGSIAQGIGYVIQKKGHNHVIEENANKKQDEPKITYLQNCMWITGFSTYIFGSIFIIAALKFGAQSVVSPLSALTLVANTLLATQFLGEPFEKNNLCGILLVIIGSATAVIFGPKAEGPDPTLDELQQYVLRTEFFLFIILLSVIAVADFIGVRYYERKNFMDNDNEKILYAGNFLMVSYVSLAAYFASINLLFMKTFVIILATFKVHYFTKWLLYIDVIGVVIVNILLEFFRQRALAYFGALFVVPIYQVSFIVGSTVIGAVFFNEFVGLKGHEMSLFVFGILIILFGVGIMAVNVGKHLVTAKDVWNVVAFPLWDGFWSIKFQGWYLTHTAFFANETLNSTEEAIATGIEENGGMIEENIDAAKGLLEYS